MFFCAVGILLIFLRKKFHRALKFAFKTNLWNLTAFHWNKILYFNNSVYKMSYFICGENLLLVFRMGKKPRAFGCFTLSQSPVIDFRNIYLLTLPFFQIWIDLKYYRKDHIYRHKRENEFFWNLIWAINWCSM